MIVSYKLTTGGSYVTLFDESVGAQLLEEFQPTFRAKIQDEPLAGSPNQFRNPVGNITVGHPLKFNQQYGSRAAAVASIRTMAALLNTKFHLQVIQDGEVQYYPNCAASEYKPKLMGVSADHLLQLTSDTVTTNAP